MAYSAGDTILDDEYNAFVNSSVQVHSDTIISQDQVRQTMD